jgi:hypothetical protein
MTKSIVADLIGAELDAAVALAEGFPSFWIDPGDDSRDKSCVLGPARAEDSRFDWSPSADWNQGGPIIEREGIGLLMLGQDEWVGDPFRPYATHRRHACLRRQQVRRHGGTAMNIPVTLLLLQVSRMRSFGSLSTKPDKAQVAYEKHQAWRRSMSASDCPTNMTKEKP